MRVFKLIFVGEDGVFKQIALACQKFRGVFKWKYSFQNFETLMEGYFVAGGRPELDLVKQFFNVGTVSIEYMGTSEVRGGDTNCAIYGINNGEIQLQLLT